MEIRKRMKRRAALSLAMTSIFVLAAAGKPKGTLTATPVAICHDDTTKIAQTDTLATTEAKDTTDAGIDAGKHRASWYRTAGHSKVHRHYPTAAYNLAPIGTRLRVTNLLNQKSCTVVVTDRMARHKKKYIDLSHMAFGIIADHNSGIVPVQVIILD